MFMPREIVGRSRIKAGSLDSKHSFSSGGYRNSRHCDFSDPNVKNVDWLTPRTAFRPQRRVDVRIISCVVDGAFGHENLTVADVVTGAGEIQRMSAGTSTKHGEMSASASKPVYFLQTLSKVDERGIAPGDGQVAIPPVTKNAQLDFIAGPDSGTGAVTLHNDVPVYPPSLKLGASISVPIAARRHVWVHVQRTEASCSSVGRRRSIKYVPAMTDAKQDVDHRNRGRLASVISGGDSEATLTAFQQLYTDRAPQCHQGPAGRAGRHQQGAGAASHRAAAQDEPTHVPVALALNESMLSAAVTRPGQSMNPLAIAHYLNIQPFHRGEGFRALGVRADDTALDPYLMVDHYWMSEHTFGAHPHAGFSAVTYMFDDAQTGFRNRDSRGDDSIIRPGDLHWTVAGSGVPHDEVPLEPGRVAHGLQIFVNLAAADKHVTPRVIKLESERMPVLQQAGGARVRLVFGAYDDGERAIAPVEPLPTNASLLDIALEDHASFRYPVAAGHTAFVLVIAGGVRIGDSDVQAGEAVAFARSGGHLHLESQGRSQAVLFLGVPLHEPVFRQGPFAMGSAADLERVMADYYAGRMGHL